MKNICGMYMQTAEKKYISNFLAITGSITYKENSESWLD